jgi:endonuclease YncB( thermonuclease family)
MMWRAIASVTEVVDGDTFHSILDIGWGIALLPRLQPKPGLGTVRVVFPDGKKYDAPEMKTLAGQKAKAHIIGLVHPGDLLEIESHEIDDFGRTLGAVKLADGRDWATVMTEAGFVK